MLNTCINENTFKYKGIPFILIIFKIVLEQGEVRDYEHHQAKQKYEF